MDVNKKRLPSQELHKLFKPLILQDNSIELLGSAGLASQKYSSDYDLFSVVKPCKITEVPIGTLTHDRYKQWYR